jgi:hypothetical protein
VTGRRLVGAFEHESAGVPAASIARGLPRVRAMGVRGRTVDGGGNGQ